jgi:hypothetical protein
LHEYLRTYAPGELVGVSCIADGADSLFAQAVLDRGGAIEVVIPAAQYRDHLPAVHHPIYDSLLEQAEAVHRLDYDKSTSAAHMAASERMISLVSELVAVWDGLPARAFGGTADVVAEARKLGLPVHVIWPDGAVRD